MSSVRLPSEGGTDPEKWQKPTSKVDNDLRLSIELGSSPEKLVLLTLKYSSGKLLLNSGIRPERSGLDPQI